jgi:hypothetical protein
MWFSCVSTQLSALRHTEVRTLSKIPGLTWISWQAFSTHCCNASNSLNGAEYTKVFRYPHSQKSRGLRSGDHAGLLMTSLSYPLFMKVRFRCCLTVRRKWGCAPSCIVIDEAAHVPRVLVYHLSKKRWYTASVSQFSKTTGPKSWSPKMPT